MLSKAHNPGGSPDLAARTHLEWASLVERVFSGLCSPAATERMLREDGEIAEQDVLPRSTELDVVQRGYRDLRAVQVLEDIAALCDGIPKQVGPLLTPVADVGLLLERAQRKVALEIDELCAVHDLVAACGEVSVMLERSCEAMADLVEAQEGDREALGVLRTRLGSLVPPGALGERLDRSLDRGSEPRLADTASEALRGLRRKVQGTRASLTGAADKLVRSQQVGKALADKFWTDRDGRVVLPVRSDAFSRAGGSGTVSGIIHGSSKTGATLFVEPHALVGAGNAWREATMAVRAEERRILAKLSAEVGEVAPALGESLDALVWLDAVYARLKLGRALGGVPPHPHAPGEGAHLRVKEARHPLMLLSGIDVVPNDLEVAGGGALIISGPNAGGKTVALKTLGLCVLMTQASLPLPTALPAEVPLFRFIVTDVGDDQSIAGGLSTFSAHMGHVRDALRCAGEDGAGTLVLLDEVAVGTDPEQGAALAEALLRELAQLGATQVITTHYERLKLLAPEDPARFFNAAVGFDFDAMVPTFTVRMGAPGASSALIVAERLGLPAVVLDRARSMLDDTRLQVDALLRDVEAHRERLSQERDAVAREARELDVRREALEKRERKDEESAAAARSKAHKAATAELRDLEAEIKRRRKALRRDERAQVGPEGVTDGETRSFARASRGALDEARHAPAAAPRDVPKAVAVGDVVRIPKLGAQGKVVDIKGEKVRVQLPLAKVTVQLADLDRGRAEAAKPARVKASLPAPKTNAGRFFGPDAALVESRHDNVIDVRGTRAHEAVVMLEVGCDRAVSDDVDVVIVRHGHGTGALRKAVREHLEHLSYAKRFRGGLSREGGDAVTVVWIQA